MWTGRATSGQQALTCRVTGHEPSEVTLELAGTLTRDTATPRVERQISEHYGDEDVRRIHLDIHNLDAIDLEGVAVLVHLFRESQSKGKVLTVEHSEGAVRRRLLTTGVLRIMERPGPEPPVPFGGSAAA